MYWFRFKGQAHKISVYIQSLLKGTLLQLLTIKLVYFSLGWSRPLSRQQQVHTHDLNNSNDFAVGHLCCASSEWTLPVFQSKQKKSLAHFLFDLSFHLFLRTIFWIPQYKVYSLVDFIRFTDSCSGRFFRKINLYTFFAGQPRYLLAATC
jgi:hypothetical protein